MFFSHCTCVTGSRTRRPVAERGHDAVLLAGQRAGSHRAGPGAVWTPRQRKHTQRGREATLLITLYQNITASGPRSSEVKENWIMLIYRSREMLSGLLGDAHLSQHSDFDSWPPAENCLGENQTAFLKSQVAEQKLSGLRVPGKAWMHGLDLSWFVFLVEQESLWRRSVCPD